MLRYVIWRCWAQIHISSFRTDRSWKGCNFQILLNAHHLSQMSFNAKAWAAPQIRVSVSSDIRWLNTVLFGVMWATNKLRSVCCCCSGFWWQLSLLLAVSIHSSLIFFFLCYTNKVAIVVPMFHFSVCAEFPHCGRNKGGWCVTLVLNWNGCFSYACLLQ